MQHFYQITYLLVFKLKFIKNISRSNKLVVVYEIDDKMISYKYNIKSCHILFK